MQWTHLEPSIRIREYECVSMHVCTTMCVNNTYYILIKSSHEARKMHHRINDTDRRPKRRPSSSWLEYVDHLRGNCSKWDVHLEEHLQVDTLRCEKLYGASSRYSPQNRTFRTHHKNHAASLSPSYTPPQHISPPPCQPRTHHLLTHPNALHHLPAHPTPHSTPHHHTSASQAQHPYNTCQYTTSITPHQTTHQLSAPHTPYHL